MKISFNDLVRFAETEKRMADILRQSPIVPLIAINEMHRFEDLILASMSASPADSIPAIEVLLRDEEAIETGLYWLSRLKKKYGKEIHILAGSIIKPEDVEKAAAAGLDGLVSGGFSERVADAALKKGMPYLPGFMTLDEVKTADKEEGLKLIKLFPARNPSAKAIAAPLSRTGIQFVENTPENAGLPVCGTATEVLAAWERGENKIILVPSATQWSETMAYLSEHGMQACCTGGATVENLAEFAGQVPVIGIGASFITANALKGDFLVSAWQNILAANSSWSKARQSAVSPGPESILG